MVPAVVRIGGRRVVLAATMLRVMFALTLDNSALFCSRLRSSRPKSRVTVARLMRSSCCPLVVPVVVVVASASSSRMMQYVYRILSRLRLWQVERFVYRAVWRSNQNWPLTAPPVGCLDSAARLGVAD